MNFLILSICFFLLVVSQVSYAAYGGCSDCGEGVCKIPYSKREKPSGIYLRASGGLSVMPKLSNTYVSGTSILYSNTVFDNGYDADVSVGYRYLSDYRTELALSYIYNGIAKNNSKNQANNIYAGNVKAYTAFINTYYDFDFHSKFVPYLGVGVGCVNRKYSWQLYDGTPQNNYQGSLTTVAAQGLLGIAYNATPHFSVLLDARYIGTPTDHITLSNQVQGASQTSGIYNLNYLTALVNLGVAYQF